MEIVFRSDLKFFNKNKKSLKKDKYSVYLEKAEYYLDSNKFEYAIEEAKKICTSEEVEEDTLIKIKALDIIADSFYNLKNYEKALEFYQKYLEICIKHFGKENSAVATPYNNIGITYNNLKNYEKALEFYQKSLEIGIKHFGEENSDVATYYNNIGATYGNLNNYEKALEFYQKSLEIGIKLFGEENSDVATYYNKIGITYGNLNNYEKALEFYQKCIEIKLKLSPERSINEIFNELGGGVPFTMAKAYETKNDLENALMYSVHAANTRKHKLGADDERTKEAISYAKEISERLNQIDKLPDWIKNS